MTSTRKILENTCITFLLFFVLLLCIHIPVAGSVLLKNPDLTYSVFGAIGLIQLTLFGGATLSGFILMALLASRWNKEAKEK